MKLYYPDNIMVMMDIRKISYETAELFLSANDQTVSDNIEILYQDVEGLIKIDNLFIPN